MRCGTEEDTARLGQEPPLVSVVIPVYNGERHLGEAIDSVLRQDYSPIEIIVVDDGSTDGTADIVRSYADVRYVHRENGGPAAARNTGIACARGEFVAFLDHDDLWNPGKLTLEIGRLRADPRLGLTMARGEMFLEDREDWPAWIEQQQRGHGEFPPLQGAVVVRRAVFELVGPFNPEYRIAEDTEWLFRAADAGIAMAVLPEVLVRRRVHSRNASYGREEAQRGLFRAVRSSIQRKRDGHAEGEGTER